MLVGALWAAWQRQVARRGRRAGGDSCLSVFPAGSEHTRQLCQRAPALSRLSIHWLTVASEGFRQGLRAWGPEHPILWRLGGGVLPLSELSLHSKNLKKAEPHSF